MRMIGKIVVVEFISNKCPKSKWVKPCNGEIHHFLKAYMVPFMGYIC